MPSTGQFWSGLCSSYRAFGGTNPPICLFVYLFIHSFLFYSYYDFLINLIWKVVSESVFTVRNESLKALTKSWGPLWEGGGGSLTTNEKPASASTSSKCFPCAATRVFVMWSDISQWPLLISLRAVVLLPGVGVKGLLAAHLRLLSGPESPTHQGIRIQRPLRRSKWRRRRRQSPVCLRSVLVEHI